MKKLLLLITGLLLLFSVDGQILRYSNYTAPAPQAERPDTIGIIDDIVTSVGVDATSHPIDLPGGLLTGDLILVFFSCDGNPTVSINTGVSGEGWTIESYAYGTTAVTGAVIWKISDGTDALTLTTNQAQVSNTQAYGLYNVNASDPITVTSATGASGNPNPPSNTGAYGAVDYLWFAVAAADSYASLATAGPADFYGFLATSINVGGSSSINSAYRSLNTAGAYDPGTFTITPTDEQWAAFTVIVNPAE